MKEYRIKWCQCPHVHHDTKVMFVEATTEDDARKIARNHIERKFGIEWFTIQTVSECDGETRLKQEEVEAEAA